MQDSRVGRLFSDLQEMGAEQVQYRELLLQMVRKDLLIRYKQSIMGFGWAVFMPLINTIVFTTIFSRMAKVQTDVPYPVYAYCGLAAWNFFASSLRFSVVSLTSNSNLVTKIYFPREIFPFSAVVVALVDFTVATTVLFAMMTYYGIGLTSTALFLPVIVLVQMMFTTGIALLLAMGNLFFRDVKYMFEVTVTVWMFATSVVYPVHQLGGRLATVLTLNPMTPIIDAYRAVLLRGELPAAGPFLSAATISFVIFAMAWIVFHRAEFKFAENV